MAARIILWVSLAGNLLLLLLLVRQPAPITPASSGSGTTQAATDASKSRQPKVVVRRLPFTWSEVESEDYVKYIANLRAIGCPEQTIRDIIIADVTHAFDQRKTASFEVPEKQWWTDDPDMDALQVVSDQILALETEKNALLTTLLGPGWQRNSAPEETYLMFDGPILSRLSPEARAAVLAVEARSRERTSALLASNPEAAGDPAQLVALREQTRAELAAVMNPVELEEYLLRYSHNSTTLRAELRGFNASSNEFRAIFKARDPVDQQLLALGNRQDPATQTRRRELERVRDQVVSSVIGPERFPLYKMTQDPLFRQAQQQAESSGADAQSVLPIYRVTQASLEELQRINRDASLSAEARAAAVQEIQSAQQQAIERIVNP